MTDAPPRALRSVLYLPGSNDRALEKARGLGTDALILDLEDAVAPEAKPTARERVCAAVADGGFADRVVTIRTNALGSRWHDDDVTAAVAARPHAIVVPKVQSAADVLRVERSLADSGIAIWAMIESPAAILDIVAIASSTDRLEVLVLGTNDLLSELRAVATPGREALLPALAQCVLAARAFGKVVLDGVYNDVRDADGFATECRQARVLGFDGKTLIHPSQLAPCNAAFSPSDRDVDHARAVIAAFDEALADGRGVATIDGKLIENLHVADARRVLALHAQMTGRD